MMRGRLVAAVGLLALAGTARAADPAACRFTPAAAGQASNALERLVALTDEQRGLGGTGISSGGIVAQREARPEERGLGGTGIVGVVTGFGSICVNGFEVQLASDTAVTVEGLPANQADVRLGQVVAIEAFTGANGLAAAKIDVSVAVAGPVSAIARDGSQMTVAGQTVAVSSFAGSADIAGVRRGDWVVVSGLRRADDSIAGTSIVKLPRRGREVFVSGIARAAAGRVEIGGLAINAAQVDAGASVAVRGTLSGGALRARAVRTEAGFSQPMVNLSVQGYGANLTTALQRLGVTGAAAPADTGVPTQVDGAIGAGGALVPQRVLPVPPPDAAARTTPLSPPALPPTPPTGTRRQLPQTAPDASAPPQRPTTLPPATRPGDALPPQPADRPTLPDHVRPVLPERVAPPPTRPDRPPPPQRPD
ncbi:MAG: hypothetical protein K1X51_04625 [Rhodospirillaceae bacterium]|nr:hypothetical protein [Rhodospirillaceae bacterium]